MKNFDPISYRPPFKRSLITFLVALLIGCVSNPNIANATNPQSTDQDTSGTFAWHDLFTQDLEKSSRFYEELLGWSFVNSLSGNPKVKRIFLDKTHIGNAIEIKAINKNVIESQWLNYISVDNVNDTLKHVEENNGAIQIPARELPQRGPVAVCLDSQKAVFGIINSQKDEQNFQQDELNSWIGSELWTKNIDDALMFYGNLFNYDMQNISISKSETYHAINHNGTTVGGIVQIPFDDVQPNWVPYIAVEDTMVVADQVLKLGGHLLTDPDRDHPENAAVIIADPSGAVFGIQQIISIENDEGDNK